MCLSSLDFQQVRSFIIHHQRKLQFTFSVSSFVFSSLSHARVAAPSVTEHHHLHPYANRGEDIVNVENMKLTGLKPGLIFMGPIGLGLANLILISAFHLYYW
ncbi:hypothetical protein HHK36_025306 [Tetracentron sinense]|uniref:Uncharacterized protein n=1 Tax=Tetracentron sinense TaxID=13715 RepID=A0A835D529_TETSI|nr:hypothetical protein HHK36_025306 [Tetracentron sinense]